MARNIKLMAWHNFFTEFRPYAAVNILYFVEITQSYTEAMSVFSLCLLSSILFEVPTGVLSDRIGRRATLILGSITFALSILLYAIASETWVLLIGAMVAGLSDALVSGNNNALVYESLTTDAHKDDFSKIWGKLNSIFQLSLGFSALLGGALLYFDAPLRILVWIGFASQIICIAVSFFIVEPRIHSQIRSNIYHDLRNSLVYLRNNQRLRLNTLANAIQFGIGDASYRFTPAFYGQVWATWAVSALSIIRNFWGALGYRFAGRIIEYYGETKSLLWCTTIMNGIGIVSALLQNIFSPIMLFINNFFYAINDVAKEKILQREFTDEQRATMGSLVQFSGSICGVIASFLLGILADITSASTAFLIAMLIRTPVIWLYWKLHRDTT